MGTTFSTLKAGRTSSLDKLAKEMASMAKSSRKQDDRFWKLTTDKIGNGQAIIRFLPEPEGEDVPFVRIWTHAFKGPGGWYFENSLTTVGKNDPVSELNSKLWQQGDKGQAVARAQKRKLSYIANIYVVKDAACPENEGKVFLFKFGKMIFDKLNEKMSPEFEGDVAVNPFDLWKGANFRLRASKKDKNFTTYEKSTFDEPAPIAKSDEEIEAIWKQAHKLQPFLAADQFKSYDELKARLEKVLAIPQESGDHGDDAAPEPHVADDEPDNGPTVPSVKPSAKNLEFFEGLAD